MEEVDASLCRRVTARTERSSSVGGTRETLGDCSIVGGASGSSPETAKDPAGPSAAAPATPEGCGTTYRSELGGADDTTDAGTAGW
eukprot:scaffold278411_cov17-Prasinocladus_malaysianus.AAC.1